MQFRTPKHPPAFPSANGPGFKGLSVRDYFASHAMSGMLADPNVTLEGNGCNRIARLAYVMADAMLAARDDGAPDEQGVSVQPLNI